MNSTRDSTEVLVTVLVTVWVTEYSPNFVKMEPPTDLYYIDIGLNPAEEHAEDTAEYHAEDLVVKVEVPTVGCKYADAVSGVAR
ncbi:hypothetical protein EB796_012414 [Bugula neritina]|uniref:Uncharacterized protein n=1 Tax=Bugula neritina TaxID=10212 RepID=A0A7J7JVC7_BUGNE|nr:hypothetical protein EB796_012414 [Bugula neritina]